MRCPCGISLGNVARSTSRTRWPFRASRIAVAAPLQRGPITMASYIGPPHPAARTVGRISASLPARSVRIALGDVNNRTMVEVGDPQRCIVDEPRDSRHVGVVDVLCLVGHLVVIEVLATRER